MRIRHLAALVGLVTALAAVGGSAFAAASSPAAATGIVHGCVSDHAIKGVHDLGVQDVGASCPKHTTELNWNQQGPRGPVGPQGPRGPQGPAGSFRGKLASPNGEFSISVTDSGIVLSGPSGHITIGATSITLEGPVINVTGSVAQITATVIKLNSCIIAATITCP